MSIANDLLFLHGHIAEPRLARELAAEQTPPPHPEHDMKTTLKSTLNPLFKGLWYLGGLDDLDPRIGLDETAYGPTYGNRLASRRSFASYARQPGRRPERRRAAKPVPRERLAAAERFAAIEACDACA